MLDNRNRVQAAQKIVVKVGTSSLTYPSGRLNLTNMERIVRQIADLHNSGKEVVLVSSGSVGAGVGELGLKNKPRTIPERQAVSAVGQCFLMQVYNRFFLEYGIITAQILLTREDMSDRRRYLNARNTMLMLINEYRALPIINENDTVATEELQLRFGDNDTLAALVASLIRADLLILLSDISGLYTGDPRKDENATLIPEVKEISPAIWATAGAAGTMRGTGGMITKLEAARIATRSGITMVLASCEEEDVLNRILGGEQVGTVFLPNEDSLVQREQWIAFAGQPQGAVVIDQGAVTALLEGKKSLLPSGVTGVQGKFEVGDLIRVLDPSEQEIARGLSNFNSEEIERIKGTNTLHLPKVLGYKTFEEVIHRNNMVCVE
ncbi:MAG TPA: glutamate 5-kinase [Firmicutes bacterium]|nr:glutamate 5-kinase [Bacillota bacterium]HBR28536.1 glutamate 5-kinase [Bacillota bacterium]HBR34321.1 glutamate 5-kinase [Bacillota bacterium]